MGAVSASAAIDQSDKLEFGGRMISAPTVVFVSAYGSCEFAENRCEIATFYCRAVNNRPYIGYGTSNL